MTRTKGTEVTDTMPNGTLTDEQLAEWEELCLLVTPGPWEMVDYRHGNREQETWLGVIRGAFEIATPRYEIGHVQYSALPHEENVANATLIAAARSAVPALLAEVRRLRAVEAEQRKALDEIHVQGSALALMLHPEALNVDATRDEIVEAIQQLNRIAQKGLQHV